MAVRPVAFARSSAWVMVGSAMLGGPSSTSIHEARPHEVPGSLTHVDVPPDTG